jgi:hypothetical protein
VLGKIYIEWESFIEEFLNTMYPIPPSSHNGVIFVLDCGVTGDNAG